MTKNTTKVSIIIPCYNHERYVSKAIESALLQTYKFIEIIVIDNGSTDGSRNIILQYEKYNNVRIILHDNNIFHPLGGGFNVVGDAIAKSSGEFISILYSDDWYLSEKIEEQVGLFDKSKSSVGVVYCHGYHYFEETQNLVKWKMQEERGYVFKKYLLNGDVVIPISPLVKRCCYEIVGLRNAWTGSEYDFFLMSQYVDFDFIDKYLVVMRDHKNNDAKNVYSVYQRVKYYHTKALLCKSSRSRGGSLINKRVAKDYLDYGMSFILMFDIDSAKSAIFSAISLYPFYVLKPKILASILILFFPLSVTKFLLKK
jgi:glycosyltransferase involved in cell wall biosynthesis